MSVTTILENIIRNVRAMNYNNIVDVLSYNEICKLLLLCKSFRRLRWELCFRHVYTKNNDAKY